jgi:hypothetical protein
MADHESSSDLDQSDDEARAIEGPFPFLGEAANLRAMALAMVIHVVNQLDRRSLLRVVNIVNSRFGARKAQSVFAQFQRRPNASADLSSDSSDL